MRLSKETAELIRAYVNAVDKIIHKYVPNTVPGRKSYEEMVSYAKARAAIIVQVLGGRKEKKSRWRQIDLEEAIKEEKKINNDTKP